MAASAKLSDGMHERSLMMRDEYFTGDLSLEEFALLSLEERGHYITYALLTNEQYTLLSPEQASQYDHIIASNAKARMS